MTLPATLRSLALASALAPLVLLASACGDKDAEGTNPGECTDRADNDGNGQFDCDDAGCAGSPDCQDGGTDGTDGTTDGDDGTVTDGDGTDGGDPGGDPGGEGEGGDPGGDPGGEGEGGDPGGEGEGGDPGGDPGGEGEGGDPGGDPGGEGGEGGGTGGGPGGGTGGGPGGGTGGGSGGGGAYDGVYTGDVTINATDGTDTDSCSYTWASGTTSCSAGTVGGCVEIVSSSILDSRAGCEMTGSFSSVGVVLVTFGGSVNSSGQVTGTLDTFSTPVMGSITTGALRASFTWSKDGIDYNGSIDLR